MTPIKSIFASATAALLLGMTCVAAPPAHANTTSAQSGVPLGSQKAVEAAVPAFTVPGTGPPEACAGAIRPTPSTGEGGRVALHDSAAALTHRTKKLAAGVSPRDFL